MIRKRGLKRKVNLKQAYGDSSAKFFDKADVIYEKFKF